jgi:hypothetical protein
MALGCEYMKDRQFRESAAALHEAFDTARRAEKIKPGTCTGWSEIAFMENLGSAYLPDLPPAIDYYVRVLRQLGRDREADHYQRKADGIRRVLGENSADETSDFTRPE